MDKQKAPTKDVKKQKKLERKQAKEAKKQQKQKQLRRRRIVRYKTARRTNRFLVVIAVLVSILFLLIGLLLIASETDKRSVFGYRGFEMRTTLMDRADDGFDQGDLVFFEKVAPDKLKKGDIIVFSQTVEKEKTFVISRISGIEDGADGRMVTTKADAEEVTNDPIKATKIIGKSAFAIPYMGYLIQFIHENQAICAVLVFSFYSCILVVRYYYVSWQDIIKKLVQMKHAAEVRRRKRRKQNQRRE